MPVAQIKKVLVVDDSAFMRKLITDFLNSHPAIEVVGVARNGKDAIDKLQTLKPDVITLDVEMPIMDGLEALKEIMRIRPTPVVMLSSTTEKGAENTVLAMASGAVDFVAKPGGAISLNLETIKDEIINKVVEAAAVQVTKLKQVPLTSREPKRESPARQLGKPNRQMKKPTSHQQMPFSKSGVTKNFSVGGKKVIAIGTSTGGPRALQEVLTKLPKNIAAPIVIVQHMPAGFTKSLADRLNNLCDIAVKEVENGDLIEDGVAYIAPGGKHFTVEKMGVSLVAKVDDKEPPRIGHRPSVNVLFESLAKISGLKCLAVVMTGMGNDGMDGTADLKANCETIAIAESQETSVVYGMPRAIVDRNLADDIVRLEDIASTITEMI